MPFSLEITAFCVVVNLHNAIFASSSRFSFSPPKEIDSLRKSIEELEKENRDLKDRLSKVEAFVEAEKKANDE